MFKELLSRGKGVLIRIEAVAESGPPRTSTDGTSAVVLIRIEAVAESGRRMGGGINGKDVLIRIEAVAESGRWARRFD